MCKVAHVFFLGFLLVIPGIAVAQGGDGNDCIGWGGPSGMLPNPGYDQKEEARKAIVRRIMRAIGSSVTITVVGVQMEGACSFVNPTHGKIIYYGASWLDDYSGGNAWVITGVLAHEVGHLVNDHSLHSANRWRQEYEADVFLGRAVSLLGGSVVDALAVVAKEPPGGGSHHPERAVRESAIRLGFSGGASAEQAASATRKSIGSASLLYGHEPSSLAGR